MELVSLNPLNLAQIVELVESLALADLDARRIAPALLKHTGGNPMFGVGVGVAPFSRTVGDLILKSR
jgi:hypothetical protein